MRQVCCSGVVQGLNRHHSLAAAAEHIQHWPGADMMSSVVRIILAVGSRQQEDAQDTNVCWCNSFHGATGRGHCLSLDPPLCKSALELLGRLNLDLLPCMVHGLSRQRVPGGDAPVFLGLVEVLDQPIAVAVESLGRDALHAENLDLETLSVGQRILDMLETLLVHLVQMDGQSCVAMLASGGNGFCKGRIAPPAVLSLRPHFSHLKCFARWCEMRSLRSLKSRSPRLLR
jgi:hypothetical protein